ncbi:MAG TPA: hypothetical protein VJQ83_01775 [Tepidiformaceae bacterium]|nr:hypothetical protein [Tepidiformaceae bacterium]
MGSQSKRRFLGRGRTTTASIAAIGSVLVAWSCCLPLLPFTVAAGLAGGSALFSEARPFLIVLAIVLIGYGFLSYARAKQCQERPSRLVAGLLWTSLGVVFVSIFFPELLANLLANLTGR